MFNVNMELARLTITIHHDDGTASEVVVSATEDAVTVDVDTSDNVTPIVLVGDRPVYGEPIADDAPDAQRADDVDGFDSSVGESTPPIVDISAGSGFAEYVRTVADFLGTGWTFHSAGLGFGFINGSHGELLRLRNGDLWPSVPGYAGRVIVSGWINREASRAPGNDPAPSISIARRWSERTAANEITEALLPQYRQAMAAVDDRP